ncbi:hypothetical protein MNBD_GAMMA12-1223 [hydrothermal vent metagenome]|uniref:Knr4/Smi1-like domain-containing protein n=1 Tax=hydrothermal vent metagenome TaxID=652676 RepID=A0A3B0ZBU3_9ZZZZ
MEPKKSNLLFYSIALFFILAVISRFEPILLKMSSLSETLPWFIFVLAFPLLFLAAYHESQLDYKHPVFTDQPRKIKRPAWMDIQSIPVKTVFSFAFTYITIVILHTLEINTNIMGLYNIVPGGLLSQFLIFGLSTFIILFSSYLGTMTILIPPLRILMKLISLMKPLVAKIITIALGIGFGFSLMVLMQTQFAKNSIGQYDSFSTNLLFIYLIILGPIALVAISDWYLKRRETQDNTFRDICFESSTKKPSIEDIKKLEQTLNAKLPQDYREFLLSTNGGAPDKRYFKYINADQEEDILQAWNFFPLTWHGENNIETIAALYEERFSKKYLPIACANGPTISSSTDAVICLSVARSDYGTIYYWEVSAIFDDSDIPIILTKSFTEYIDSLEK